MDLYFIDYFSNSGRSAIHRRPYRFKVAGAVLCIGIAVFSQSVPLLFAVLLVLAVLYVIARIPPRVLPLLLYPLLFTSVFLFSVIGGAMEEHAEEPGFHAGDAGAQEEEGALSAVIALTVLKVLVAASVMLLLMLTTPSADLFRFAQMFFPKYLLTGLVLMYRSMFILSDALSDLLALLKLRGGFSLRRPVLSLRNLGTVFSVMLVRALNLAEKQYDVLRLRGFEGRLYISKSGK